MLVEEEWWEMTRLYHQKTLLKASEGFAAWQLDAFQLFKNKMLDKHQRFPCIPATQGFALNQFKYGFVHWGEDTAKQLAGLLKEYASHSRNYGKYTSLIVFFGDFKQSDVPNDVDDYYTLFWNLLNDVSQLDEESWPEQIPTDPKEPLWQFCYNGEALFVYCGTPAHQKRKSRHFPYFMLAITPRWVFEAFREVPKHANNIQKKIHERLEKYDTIEIHPELKTYGYHDNFEWKQYFFRDDNNTPLACPFVKTKQED